MNPDEIPMYITWAEKIVTFFREMNLADGAVLLLVGAFFFPSVRKRLVAALGGNGNGNNGHYVTKDELDKHVEEDGKRVEDVKLLINDRFTHLEKRIDDFFTKK